MSTQRTWPQEIDYIDWWSLAHETWKGACMADVSRPEPQATLLLKHYPKKTEEEAVTAAKVMGRVEREIRDVLSTGRFRKTDVTGSFEETLDWPALEDHLAGMFPLVSNHGLRKCMQSTVFNSFVR